MLEIKLNKLPQDFVFEEKNSMEITDSKVLTQINQLIPELFQTGLAANNTWHAIEASSRVLYEAIIPPGATLARSTTMEDAVRGFYHDSVGIGGQANWVKRKENTNISGNAMSMAMSVASIVVGQYYMSQINSKLNDMNYEITKISNFQDNEYKSRVYALLAQIQKATVFKSDTLSNEELRLSEIDNINRWEQECVQLLGQANLSITDIANKRNLEYEVYEKEVYVAQNWFVYQKTLMRLLVQIAELKYALYLGSASRMQCDALVSPYSHQVQEALQLLNEWHESHIDKLEIQIDNNSRKRKGLDSAIHFIPGLIKKENRFCAMSNDTVKMIVEQTEKFDLSELSIEADLFDRDVRIIAKDGKIYYLPNKEM
ncbi:MAG: hypothetical protein IJ512_04125 [Ruminococcus sp.]|nr:hypothetical protein [Ruminococcus sp.]